MTHGIGEVVALLAAGLAAGTINTVVGSGTLITFPTLLAFGYSPVLANVTNTVGLVPGVISGVHGYRRELQGQRARLLLLGSASVLGGVTGAILLLTLPAGAFKAIVPALIVVALVLVVAQPALGADAHAIADDQHPDHSAPYPERHGKVRNARTPFPCTCRHSNTPARRTS